MRLMNEEYCGTPLSTGNTVTPRPSMMRIESPFVRFKGAKVPVCEHGTAVASAGCLAKAKINNMITTTPTGAMWRGAFIFYGHMGH